MDFEKAQKELGYAPRPVELVRIETSGDVIRDLPLSQIGGDGLFTKEIQRALLMDVVDVAVHSQLTLVPAPGRRHEIGRKKREEGIRPVDVVFDSFDEPAVWLRIFPGVTAKTVTVEPVGDLATVLTVLVARPVADLM